MALIEKARVCMSGRSQAVRIPAAYRFKTDEVYLQRDPQTGAITLTETAPHRTFEDIFRMFDAAEGAESFLDDRDGAVSVERDWI